MWDAAYGILAGSVSPNALHIVCCPKRRYLHRYSYFIRHIVSADCCMEPKWVMTPLNQNTKQFEILTWVFWTALNSYCTNLIAGQNICVGPPGGYGNFSTISGATVTQTAQYATTTASRPTPVASGTTLDCGRYYLVQPVCWFSQAWAFFLLRLKVC